MNILLHFFFFAFSSLRSREKKNQFSSSLGSTLQHALAFFPLFKNLLFFLFYSIFFSLCFISRASDSRRCRRHHQKILLPPPRHKKDKLLLLLLLPCVAVYCVRAESDHSPLFCSLSLAHTHAHTYTQTRALSLYLSTIERHRIQTQTPVLAKRDTDDE